MKRKRQETEGPVPVESLDFRVDIKRPYCLGIDEAGRGPVLGDMVYACAYCPLDIHQQIRERGFDDSKKLTPKERENLFKRICFSKDVGFIAMPLSPQSLSNCQLRKNKYNLNTISHNTAISLIQQALDRGVPLQQVFVDTVGPPEKYENLLNREFGKYGVECIVRKKADSIYPIVGAASICAKVIRDNKLKYWSYCEKNISPSKVFGSGYPGDEVTCKWLEENMDHVFGFPSIVRFSWKTTSNILEKNNAATVEWEPPQEKKRKRNQQQLFVKTVRHNNYFSRTGIKFCSDF